MERYSLFFLFFLLTGCTSALENSSFLTPSPSRSEYFVTKGAGFMGTAKGGILKDLYYALTLRAVKTFDRDVLLEICFENPKDVKRPVCVHNVLKQGEKEVDLQSPVMEGFVNRQNYEVLITLEEKGNSKPIRIHRQLIRYYDVHY